jgi:hypothetical protein
MHIDRKFLLATTLIILVAFSAGIMTFAFTPSAPVHENVIVRVIRADGTTETLQTHNLVTTLGLNWVKTQLSSGAPSANITKYISLSMDATTPVVGDTIVASEITTNGLQRAAGTYASVGTGNWTITNTFTSAGTFTSVQKAGLNYDPTGNSGGNLFAEALFSPVNLNSGDQLQITWYIWVT